MELVAVVNPTCQNLKFSKIGILTLSIVKRILTSQLFYAPKDAPVGVLELQPFSFAFFANSE